MAVSALHGLIPAENPRIIPQQHHIHQPSRIEKVLSAHNRLLLRRLLTRDRRIAKLETKLAAEKAMIKPKEPEEDLKFVIERFIRLMRTRKISFDVKLLTQTFLKMSQTAEEVSMVLIKNKTMQRVKSKIKEERDSTVLSHYKTHQTHTDRIFKTRSELLDHKNSLCFLYGKNILKYHSSTMLFYQVPLKKELQEFKIKTAHFDGKYSDVPVGYLQSVELRLVLAKEDKEIIITFAKALLIGSKIADYAEFFERVKRAHYKHIPHLMVDFELAISRDALEVFPGTKIRSCWFHYWNNLSRRSGRIKRYTKIPIPVEDVRLLALLSFFHAPEIFLHVFVGDLWYDTPVNRHRNGRFKLALYVYKTYLCRYHHQFSMDLFKCITRTNNSCEGSNSGMSKYSTQRLSLEQYRGYVEIGFKQDSVKPIGLSHELTKLDKVLMAIQKASKHNVDDLVKFLLGSEELKTNKLALLEDRIPVFPKDPKLLNGERVAECIDRLEDAVKEHRAYKKLRTIEWQEF